MPNNEDTASTNSSSPRSSTSTRVTQSTPASSPGIGPIPLQPHVPPPPNAPLPPIPQFAPPPPLPPAVQGASSSGPNASSSARSTFSANASQTPGAGPSGTTHGGWGPQAGVPPLPQGGNANTAAWGNQSDSMPASPTSASPRLPPGTSNWADVNFFRGGGGQTPAQASSGALSPDSRARNTIVFGGAYHTNPDGSRRRSDALPRPSGARYDLDARSKSSDFTPKPRKG